jgi:hypothetical protein
MEGISFHYLNSSTWISSRDFHGELEAVELLVIGYIRDLIGVEIVHMIELLPSC